MRFTNAVIDRDDSGNKWLKVCFDGIDEAAIWAEVQRAMAELPDLVVPAVDDGEVARLESQRQEVKRDLQAAEDALATATRAWTDAIRNGTPPGDTEAAVHAAKARIERLKHREAVIASMIPAAQRDLQARRAEAEAKARAALRKELEARLTKASDALVAAITPHVYKAAALRKAIRDSTNPGA